MHLDRRLLRLARQGRVALLTSIGLGTLAGALAIPQAKFLSQIINKIFLKASPMAEVSAMLAFLLVILTLRIALNWGGDLAAQSAARRIKRWLREEIIKRLNTAGPAYTSGEQAGELTQTFVEGVEAIDPYFSQYLPGLALAGFTPLIILIFVFQIDGLSGVVFLLTAPLIPVFMSLIGSLAQTLTRSQWKTLSRLSAYFLDVLQGLTTLKMLGRSKEQTVQIAEASELFHKTTMNVLRVTFLSALTLEMVSTLSTAVVAVEIGLRLLYARITFEQALVILLLAPEYYQPLRSLGARFHAGMSGVEAARRIFELPGEPAEEIIGREPACAKSFKEDAASLQQTIKQSIRFADVAVSYEEGRPALKGVSFELRSGERLGLVGPSGSGKSTIAAMLLRFVSPERGAITVDDQPIDQIPASNWREKVAWVPQHPNLFDDTIAANIRLGKPEANMAAVVAAAKLAEADEFILTFPLDYETRIGEGGVRLSGGEAQRIALARAFLKDAELVILDEATAHLDLQTETYLQRGIERLLENRTALIIAHRLKTVQKADRVIVLEDGEIRQEGSHAELFDQEGLYRSLCLAAEQGSWREGLALFERIEPVPDKAVVSLQSETQPIWAAKKHGNRLSVFFWLIQMAVGIWKPALISVFAGAATVLSSVGLLAASAYIISMAALHPSIALLQVPIVAVRFFGITRGLFRYAERYFSHQATFQLLARLRVWFYQALEPLAPARLMRYQSGDLLARILGDIQSLENFYVRALAPPLSALLGLFAVFLFVSTFDLGLALILLVFWMVAGLVAPIAALRQGRAAGSRFIACRGKITGQMVEYVQGLADLQVYDLEGRFARRLAASAEELASTQQQISRLGSTQTAFTGLMANLGMWSLLTMTIPLISSGQIQGVYLAVLVMTALTSFEAVLPLPAAAQFMESNLQSALRLFEIADADPEVHDPDIPLSIPSCSALRVENLSFSYPGGMPVISGLTFDLPVGKRTAIVGPSGSGKTTLVNLLLRFWDYQSGQILFDGLDLRRCSQDDVRAQISIVPQQVYLFSASLRDNLLIARPLASEEDLVHSAQQAGIHDFIVDLPDGFETWVGEHGGRLSGGERQRIVIARALLRPAPLLILDEGTAHLDPLRERQVLGSIFEATKNSSLLMITHRLVRMEAMDEILVMDKGCVIERGKHAELLSLGGMYAALWDAQKLQDALEEERLIS